MAELEAIRYIVDENTLALGKVMAELRDDTAVIGLPPVDQFLRRGMSDIEWIPVVGSRGRGRFKIITAPGGTSVTAGAYVRRLRLLETFDNVVNCPLTTPNYG